jgi:hypothetical protein
MQRLPGLFTAVGLTEEFVPPRVGALVQTSRWRNDREEYMIPPVKGPRCKVLRVLR